MARSKAIKNALVDLIDDLTYEDETAFTSVVGHNGGEFDGYPAVRVLPGDTTTEKASVSQNDRTLTFIVRTHLPVKEDGSEVDYMYDLTDLLLDQFDSGDFLNALNAKDATIKTHILNATRGDWFDSDTGTGVVLMCDINVEVRYSKNL